MEINPVLNIINQKAVEKAVDEYKKHGMALAIDNTMFEIEPYCLPPYPGLKLKPDFPNCCEFHQSVFEAAVNYLILFPNCCKYHKPLIGQKWFQKQKYNDFPIRLLKTLVNTESCIESNIEKENWYKAITDYIEIAIMSMGQFPAGFGSAMGLQLFTDNIIGWMDTQNSIQPKKKVRIKKFIIDWTRKYSADNKFNLIELLNVYDTWLKLFPFELPFFQSIKERFYKTRPVIKGPIEINTYTGLKKGILFTTKDFCEYLHELTKILLAHINTQELTKKYSLDEAIALEFEYSKNQHSIRQQKLFSTIIQENDIGNTSINTWLENEKLFVVDLIKFLESKSKLNKEIKMETVSHPIHFIDQYLEEVQSLKVLVVERYYNQGGYIKEVDPKVMANLPFKKGNYLCIDQYDQSESNYEAEITRLQEKALNEAIMLNEFQVNNVINRVQYLIDKYELFWPKYSQLCDLNREGRLNMADIEILIYPFFNIDKHGYGQITIEFIDGLHDAVMFKQGSLLEFNQVLKNSTGKDKKESVEKVEKVDNGESAEIIECRKLEDIFLPEFKPYFKDFLSALQLSNKPPLDDEGKYLPSGQKNLFVIWFKALEHKHVIERKVITDIEKANLLMQQFPGLTISGSLFRQENTRANNLKGIIEAEIASIKGMISSKKG